MKYVLIDTSGFPTAFYSPDIHNAIPPEAIEITDAQWIEFINNQGRRKFDAVTRVVVEHVPVIPLDALKAMKKQEMQQAFADALAAGYTCTNGIKMNAKEYDVEKLDNGSRLAARLGRTTLTVRDFNNVRHPLPLADVDTMVGEIGASYQALLQRYWDRDDAIRAATVEAEVNAVVW